MVINGRTDMADELRRRLCDGESVTELPGVRAREERIRDFPVVTVDILDRRGEEALGKPSGTYITMELPQRLADCLAPAAETLSELIRRCAGTLPQELFLVGLGNPDITPDAVGSLAASQLLVTRHLKQQDPASFTSFRSTALCRPGVLGTTGIESARQILALCRELRPEMLLVIDVVVCLFLTCLAPLVMACLLKIW